MLSRDGHQTFALEAETEGDRQDRQSKYRPPLPNLILPLPTPGGRAFVSLTQAGLSLLADSSKRWSDSESG